MFLRSICTLNRLYFRTWPKTNRLVLLNRPCLRPYANSKVEEDEELDAPIKYSTSPAKEWQAKDSRIGKVETRLWYEPVVILVSLTIFMVYFTIIREENDIDEELNKSLYNRIDGLEEQQLRVLLEYNQERNLETDAILKRLEEIESQKSTPSTH